MQASGPVRAIRLAHFSDVHLSAPRCGWKPRDWFSKRFTSWLNHRALGRAARFALAEEIVAALMDELPRRDIDHAVFSGDATALGFEAEIRQAAQMLRVEEQRLPALAIPGNHDYCTRSAAASGHFERYFAAWQQGRRIGEHRYPFAQQAGAVWLIAVNAATGNRLPWDAGGSVDADQLDRLRRLLDSLEAGIKILVLHFPIRLSNGRREPFYHGLRNLDPLMQVARAGGVNLWLHGHRHSPYYLERPGDATFPAICAGTATQRGIWSYGEYTIDGTALQAVRRAYQPATRGFVDVETFSLQLR
jgi:3',5'-cyclic AMP phosphodiesterase CpdA